MYQYTAAVPGVTGTGFPGQPRVRGGQVTDLGYEFEGIPIADRSVGFYTTTLSNIGVSNLEVYTGGLGAANAANGTGLLNSVMKVGTYPGFTNIAVDVGSPDFNHYLTFERGYATPDHRWSYYVGFSGSNENTTYAAPGAVYPGVMFWGNDGPGPIYTRDLVGNFHYRPGNNDDLQFVITNGYGFFNYDYLINKGPGQPPVLQFEPCKGATANSNTFTGASGGTSPNGSTCPLGLYWGAIPNDSGNRWYQYAALGKLQWNHTLNSHSYFSLRFAENYGAYIFNQPIGDANIPAYENPGDFWNWAQTLGMSGSACPTYPYPAGSPVVSPAGDSGDLCAFDDGIQNFWGERRSNMFFGFLDYENLINSHVTLKTGISDEHDNNIFHYELTNQFSTQPNGSVTWPALYEDATYPTNRQQIYGEGDFHTGNFLLVPGLMYGQEHYGFPGGKTVSVLNPTFNGTFTVDPRNVLRFSYGDTASFIGSTYVYTTPNSLITRNPLQPGVSFDPQINHNADLMWEHQFNSDTSLRVGPWVSKTTNYYEDYTPIIGHLPDGTPIFSKTSVLANNQRHQDFGVEFALNHVDNRELGTSYWISATYDNYWTTSTALASAFINSPEPQNLIDANVLLRASENPLWSATAVFDFHSNGFHFDPMIVYQTDYYYYNLNNSCQCAIDTSLPTPQIVEPISISGAFWTVNLQAYKEFGSKRNFFVGFKVDNLFDNTNDVAPCMSDGSGCFPYDGPYSGVVNAPGSYMFQNYAEDPYIGALSVNSMQRLFEFYAGVRM